MEAQYQLHCVGISRWHDGCRSHGESGLDARLYMLLIQSQLYQDLQCLAFDEDGNRLMVYTDSGFASDELTLCAAAAPERSYLVVPCPLRISVENCFGELQTGKLLHYSQLSLLAMPLAVLFHNIHNTIDPNGVSGRFGISPPTLESYLS